MTRRAANEAMLAAAAHQRRWRTTVETLAQELDEHPHDQHFRNTLRVARHRLAEAEKASAEADEALAAAARAEALAVAFDQDEGRWPAAVDEALA